MVERENEGMRVWAGREGDGSFLLRLDGRFFIHLGTDRGGAAGFGEGERGVSSVASSSRRTRSSMQYLQRGRLSR